MRHFLWLAVTLWVAFVGGLVGPVGAQAPTAATTVTTQGTNEPIDYSAWENAAQRAEEAIQNGRASNYAMEQLRRELSGWRAIFLTAQDENASRIATVREQIAALGPAPEAGAEEVPEIAQRRAELNQQLETLLAPVIKAEEAYRRADGLIGEIDGLIRSRQTDALIQLGPSPLNPAHWLTGWEALYQSLRGMGNELISDWQNQLRQTEFRDKLPVTLVLLLIGTLLLLRGRAWMVGLTNRFYNSSSRHSRRVLASVISLGQVVVPYIGLLALVEALHSSNLLGLRLGRLVETIPTFGLIILFTAWIAGRVFPRHSSARPILELDTEKRARARLQIVGLGVIIAMRLPLAEMADFDNFDPAAMATLQFPLVLLAALLLWRVSQVLLHQGQGQDESRVYLNSIQRQIGRFAIAVAVIAPLLAAVGYTQAANFLLFPTILSLGFGAVVTLAQRFAVDLYILMTREDETTARDKLVPVLLSFAVVLISLPILALIWGVRPTDLSELWTRFTEGFSIGDTKISPMVFLIFVIVFAIGYGATRLVQGALRSSVLPKTSIDPGGQTAIVSGIGYIGVFLAAVLAISAAGLDLSSLAIVAGALSVGIGFGLQNIVSNFVSGIILLIERPVREGDWIEVGGIMGTVRDISVRSTRIETFDRTDVIVPNADLISGSVTNWTKQNLTGRLILKVGVAYGTDTRKVERILREIGEAHPLVIINPAPLVIFQGFGADSLDFELRVILRDINFGLSARSEINHEIARRFAEEGIEIPFAQRDIWLRNPEALRPRTASNETASGVMQSDHDVLDFDPDGGDTPEDQS